jgi:hypothetical protein
MLTLLVPPLRKGLRIAADSAALVAYVLDYDIE